MARKLSTAAANYLATEGSVAEMHEGGVLVFYSGTQPTSADAAVPADSVALVAFTSNGGNWTREVRGACVIDFSGCTGHVNVLTLGAVSLLSAAVSFVDTAENLALAVVAAVNAYRTYPNFTASIGATATKVVLTAPKNAGAKLANMPIVVTMASGSAAAINGGGSTTFGGTGCIAAGTTVANGLTHSATASGGVALKSGTWKGTGGTTAIATALNGTPIGSFSTTATAGWFRFYATGTDPEITSGTRTADSSAAYIRIDGTIATSGGDITATGGTTITATAEHTENTYTISVPTAQ